MKPRLSILIPTYRRPEDLERALSSIPVESTAGLGNLIEIIVREDHSGPEYEAAYEKVHLEFSNVIKFYANKSNLGMAGNLRALVQDAQGQFVFILTDDDQLCTGGLEVLLELLEKMEHHRVGSLLLPRHSYLDDGKKITVSSRTIGFGRIGTSPATALRLCSKGFILTGMVFKRQMMETFDWDRFGENAYFPVALQYHALREGGGLRSSASIVSHTVNNETHWHRWGSDESSQRERLGRDFLTIYDELTQDAMGSVCSRAKRMYFRLLRLLNAMRFLASQALNPHPDPDHDAYAAWLRIQGDGALRFRMTFLVVTKVSIGLAGFVRLSRRSVDAMADVVRFLSRRSKSNVR